MNRNEPINSLNDPSDTGTQLILVHICAVTPTQSQQLQYDTSTFPTYDRKKVTSK